MNDIVNELRTAAYVSPPRKAEDYSKAVSCDLLARAADEIDSLRRSVERKRQQYERSQRYWVEAAQKALAGDAEHLRLRVDMALSGPIEMTETAPII